MLAIEGARVVLEDVDVVGRQGAGKGLTIACMASSMARLELDRCAWWCGVVVCMLFVPLGAPVALAPLNKHRWWPGGGGGGKGVGGGGGQTTCETCTLPTPQKSTYTSAATRLPLHVPLHLPRPWRSGTHLRLQHPKVGGLTPRVRGTFSPDFSGATEKTAAAGSAPAMKSGA